MGKKFVKGIMYLAAAAALCCIVFLLFSTYQAKKDPQKIPAIFGYKPMTVLTNSMKPEISAGDIVLVKETEVGDIRKGDILTFETTGGKVITHRVSQVTQGGFITKGDNNNVADKKKADPSNVLGTVSFILPNAGFIAKFISSKLGFSLFVLLPFLLYILIEVYQRVIKHLDEKEKTAKVH
ncbi:signal peptidase I [Lysinibacillus sphaericus]